MVSSYEFILRIGILSLIYVLAFSSRLYSVLRYESVIHEFDPYFNFRTTKVLINEGFYNFLNWFDTASWYPLGRIVGGTVYPGLMVTAGVVYWVLNFFHFTVNIRNVCVLLAPWFSSNTAMATYYLVKQVKNSGSGLFAAAFIAIVPAYISRSVAGSYDNEGVAIFALVFTFSLWIKSINTGSVFWSVMASLAYFYMVSAWGGYVFIINLIPLYTFVLILIGRYSPSLYVAYSIFYTLGTLLAMQVTFVGFAAVYSSEHFASFGMFGFIQIYAFIRWIKGIVKPETFKKLWTLSIPFVVILGLLGLIALELRSPWSGRFYSMFDPTYAKAHIPIIASVSEHQPTIWATYIFDLHILAFFAPAGMYFCLKEKKNRDANIFLVCYAVTTFYFSSVMVRLMLVLAPIACMLSGISLSSILEIYFAKKGPKEAKISAELKALIVGGICVLLSLFTSHCVWVTSNAYSSPSIVLATQLRDGSQIYFDDFRGAYRWLNFNTPPESRVMSWWDYGYQMAAMANRTVLVDNNTWNNTHIATVGLAMASSEEQAYPILLKLDVDYVLVIFGGMVGYSSDDINKFLWMVRIGGGVYPWIKEADYFTPRGEYRIDAQGSPTLLNSLIYKMCYYRFGEVVTDPSKPSGFDRVRNAEIGNKNIKFKYLEEAYTSEHWLVRIYKVKKLANRA